MSITLRLAGKRLREALTNGIELVLVMNDGSEAHIMWVDDNGTPIKGRPLLWNTGVRMKAHGMQELINASTVGLRHGNH